MLLDSVPVRFQNHGQKDKRGKGPELSPHREPESDESKESIAALERHLDQFIEAWERGGSPPDIDSFLPPVGLLRRQVLIELIKVDLEYRWLIHHSPRHMEQYLERFPELGQSGLPDDLLYEEYHVRCRAGLEVDPAEYLQRFPDMAGAFGRLLGLEGQDRSTPEPQLVRASLFRQFRPGDRIDDFDLLTRLGQGAFAAVFLARQNSMQRLVALKISADRGNEPQALAQFDHDFIVRVHDVRSLPEKMARLLYMQYVPGGTLGDVIKVLRDIPPARRSGASLLKVVDQVLEERGETRAIESSLRSRLSQMSWPQVVSWIGARLAEALDYAHQQGVLHRDVKPANVLLTAEAAPKLADFNISSCSQLDGSSPSSYFGGSLAYMSPEQLEASHPTHPRDPESLDGRTDIYSLGVLLWELLSGQLPFSMTVPDGSWPQTLERLADSRRRGVTEIDWPSSCPAPAGIRHAVESCLAPDPGGRPDRGNELARQLDLCADQEAHDFIYPRPNTWQSRWRPFLLTAIVLAAAVPNLLAAIFNFLYNHREIVSEMGADAERHFLTVQAIINGIAFPIGFGFGGWLAFTVTRAARQTGPLPGTGEQLHQRALSVGHLAALIGLSLWTLAGLAYPLSMRWGRFEVAGVTYGHFFASLVLCGMFAVSLTYFAVTLVSVRGALPGLLQKRLISDASIPGVASVARRSWLYLALSASVPMLATVALAAINSPRIRVYLAVISLGGMLAFGISVYIHRLILKDLEILNRISQPEPNGRGGRR